jgi:phosphoribosylformylglycinamidine synthase
MIAGIFESGYSPAKRNLITPWANIFLVGETHTEHNGTEFQRIILGEVKGLPPKYRATEEKQAMDAILQAHSKGLIRSCNNVGRGGLGVALMKMVLNSDYGFKLDLEGVPGDSKGLAEQLFSESSGRYIAEVTESNQPEFLKIMEEHDLKVCELGLTVTEPEADFGKFSIPIEEAREAYRHGLRKYME